ncbi:MAG: c-type cytochrome biogenesis protein CcmI [Pseudomonadota bacterium]
MFFWVTIAVMTAALIAVVLRPLFRSEAGVGGAVVDASAVYRDQLVEIERDRAAGLIASSEADVMRAEVARRLLALEAMRNEAATPEEAVRSDDEMSRAELHYPRAAAISVLGCVPIFSLLVYMGIGSPSLPSQPHAARVFETQDDTRIAELIRRVESRLATHPKDGRGWEVLAPVYMRLGRFDEAARAWRNAETYLGVTPRRVFGQADALVRANNGIVGEAARKTFLRGLELDETYLPAKFWLALAKLQDGDRGAAKAELEALLPATEQNSPLGQAVRAELAGIAGTAPAQAPAVTPEMVEGMVAGLAERLAQDGDDIDGWLRLVRSYMVLKKPVEARAALMRARTRFAENTTARARLDALATQLGLET